MLYAEIYDQFVRATAEEKEADMNLDDSHTLLERLNTNANFAAVEREYSLPDGIKDHCGTHPDRRLRPAKSTHQQNHRPTLYLRTGGTRRHRSLPAERHPQRYIGLPILLIAGKCHST